jgi:hypothetical protein
MILGDLPHQLRALSRRCLTIDIPNVGTKKREEVLQWRQFCTRMWLCRCFRTLTQQNSGTVTLLNSVGLETICQLIGEFFQIREEYLVTCPLWSS